MRIMEKKMETTILIFMGFCGRGLGVECFGLGRKRDPKLETILLEVQGTYNPVISLRTLAHHKLRESPTMVIVGFLAGLSWVYV